MELRWPRQRRRELETPAQTEARIGRYVTALLGDKPSHEAQNQAGRYVLWHDKNEVVIDCHDPHDRTITEQWRFGSVALRGAAEPVLGITRLLNDDLPAITATDLTIFQRQLEGFFGPDLMAAGVYDA